MGFGARGSRIPDPIGILENERWEAPQCRTSQSAKSKCEVRTASNFGVRTSYFEVQGFGRQGTHQGPDFLPDLLRQRFLEPFFWPVRAEEASS